MHSPHVTSASVSWNWKHQSLVDVFFWLVLMNWVHKTICNCLKICFYIEFFYVSYQPQTIIGLLYI